MISPKCNRVQEIKSKFETLNSNEVNFVRNNSENASHQTKNRIKVTKQLSEPIKYPAKSHPVNKLVENQLKNGDNTFEVKPKPSCSNFENHESATRHISIDNFKETHSKFQNNSKLEACSDSLEKSIHQSKGLSRQVSDPVNKKLHRSHAFRRDRNQKSFNCKRQFENVKLEDKPIEKSRDKLTKLENILDHRLQKEKCDQSLPFSLLKSDSDIPQHILDQYAKVNKKTKNQEPIKTDKLNENHINDVEADNIILDEESLEQALTDSGVSSDTENNNETEPNSKNRFKRLISQFEDSKTDNTNNQSLRLAAAKPDLYASNETIRLEKKNPHIKLTDTLKKALKQPLPAGPPPKKPPRSHFQNAAEAKKDSKSMLDKLERAFEERTKTSHKRQNSENIYDIAEADESTSSKKKDFHYMCTELLSLPARTTPETNIAVTLASCFHSLNCGVARTSTLGYSRIGSNPNSICYSGQSDSDDNFESSGDYKNKFSTFFQCKNETKSQFYVDKEEHIYCEPFEVRIKEEVVSDVEAEKFCDFKTQHLSSKLKYRSLEDVRINFEEAKIYDIPCETSRSPSPIAQKLNGDCKPHLYGSLRRQRHSDPPKLGENRPKLSPPDGTFFSKPVVKRRPKPVDLPIVRPTSSKSLEILDREEKSRKFSHRRSAEELNRSFEFAEVRKSLQSKIASESLKNARKYEKNSKAKLSDRPRIGGAKLNGTDSAGSDIDQLKQLVVDKENLNKLMCEIYERVSNDMEISRPGKFPTESADNTSEESVKLTRSLTEKRKRYLRRVSSIHNTRRRLRHQTSLSEAPDVIAPTAKIRSWRSFSINLRSPDATAETDAFFPESTDGDEDATTTAPSVDRSDRLMDMCLLVCHGNSGAYIKHIYPSDATPPAMVETLIYPDEDRLGSPWQHNQQYCLILTNEIGERGYLYARRVLPEGSAVCLPATYCLITWNWDPCFYYKVLKEIEQRHGYSQSTRDSLLKGLYESKYPAIDQSVTVDVTQSNDIVLLTKDSAFRNSVNLGDITRGRSLAVHNGKGKLERCNSIEDLPKCDSSLETIVITRSPPTHDALKNLVEVIGASGTVRMFASLLLERKVVIVGDQLSTVSACTEGIISLLYPMRWQHTLVSLAPKQLVRELASAPVPILASMLKYGDVAPVGEEDFVDGILIDITADTKGKIVYCAGDESTILPSRLHKTLKAYLQQIIKDTGPSERNRGLMLLEGFQRFFEQVLAGYQNCYGEDNEFDREAFLKNAPNKQLQYFLEWFTETSMFDHFVQNARNPSDYYEPFLLRLRASKPEDKAVKGLGVLKNVWEMINK